MKSVNTTPRVPAEQLAKVIPHLPDDAAEARVDKPVVEFKAPLAYDKGTPTADVTKLMESLRLGPLPTVPTPEPPVPPMSPEVAALGGVPFWDETVRVNPNDPANDKAIKEFLAGKPAVAIAVIAVGQVIEWKKGRFAGTLGHVIAVEPDGVICVQQPCDLPALRWFKAPNGEFKVIGRAAGRYKIPDAEIARQIERLKPKAKKMEDRIDE